MLVTVNEKNSSLALVISIRAETKRPSMLHMYVYFTSPIPPNITDLSIPLAEVLYLSTSIAYARENIDVAVA